jgi:1-acyl-sn-glycerol-3-phosphate acyltransferase
VSLWLRFGRWVARSRLSAGLDGVWIDGLAGARDALARGPVVFACTHQSVLDPMVAVLVAEAAGGEHRYLMDAANYEKIRWFGRVGAVPIDRSSPAKMRKDLRAAVDGLSGPGRALWVFPQGRHVLPWRRPLGLQPGAGWIAKQAKAALLPVSLSYAYVEAPVPRASLVIGPAIPAERGVEDGLEAALVAGLARADAAFVESPEAPFTALLPSAQRREDDGWPSRLLSFLAGDGRAA